jgi:four helix bundle protein
MSPDTPDGSPRRPTPGNARGGNPIAEKSKSFAVDCVRMYKHLLSKPKEFVLSKQFVRSGTSIGANVHEAIRAQSKADFLAKMSIALKEAQETDYWLDILHETGFVSQRDFNHLHSGLDELLRLLTSICRTSLARSSRH